MAVDQLPGLPDMPMEMGEGRALLGGVGVFQIFFSFLFGGARMGNLQHKYCWGTQQVLISFVVARKG